MNLRAYVVLCQFVVVGIRIHTVRKEYHDEVVFRVGPHESASKPSVSEASHRRLSCRCVGLHRRVNLRLVEADTTTVHIVGERR